MQALLTACLVLIEPTLIHWSAVHEKAIAIGTRRFKIGPRSKTVCTQASAHVKYKSIQESYLERNVQYTKTIILVMTLIGVKLIYGILWICDTT